MRERGLKLESVTVLGSSLESLPMRERGLKPFRRQLRRLHPVAPHAGAWVETDYLFQFRIAQMSLPVWERGLKHHIDTGLAVFSGRSPCGSVG